MAPPTFDPNSAYSVPSFDPNAAYQAAQQGATPHPTNATASPEGFWHSLGSQFGITPEAAQQAWEEFKSHPIDTISGASALRSVAHGVASQVKRTFSDAYDAGQSLAAGNKAQAGVDAVDMIPILGPAELKAADQYGDSNIAGAAGTIAGAAAQAAPMVAGAADSMLPANRPMIPNPPIKAALGRAALLGRTPAGAYESALKPSTTLPQATRDAIVQTGLQEGIPVTKAGVEKIGDLIDDLNSKIEAQIQAAGPNRTISPGAAVGNLKDVRAKFANQVNPTADVQAVDNSGKEFLDQFRSVPGGAVRNMSAAEAQSMKQGTYRVLAGKYGEQGSAAVESQKALARGLKDEIAGQFPEIANMNAQESNLLDLQPVLEKAVARIGNHQGIGIGTPIAGAAAEAVTGSPGIGRVAMVMKGVLDNPAVKSRLAIAVSKGGKIPYAQAMSKVNAYSAALGSAAMSSASPDQSQQSDTSQ